MGFEALPFILTSTVLTKWRSLAVSIPYGLGLGGTWLTLNLSAPSDGVLLFNINSSQIERFAIAQFLSV